MPITAGPRDQSASLPVLCHAQQGGQSGPVKTEVGSSHGCAQKAVRTGDDKVSLRVTQTQAQPRGVSGHCGLDLSPLPAGLLIPETSALGCSRTRHSSIWDVLPLVPTGGKCFIRISVVTFSLLGKSKSLIKGYCSREALPSTQLQSVPCSLAFLSFLTWFYVFCFPKCDHSSLLSQRLCPTCWNL